MKAKLLMSASGYQYFGFKNHAADLDVSMYTVQSFSEKFTPLYKEIQKRFRVSGNSCSHDRHKIGMVIPAEAYNHKGITEEGLAYCNSILEFLKPYGFTQLVYTVDTKGSTKLIGSEQEIADNPRLQPTYTVPEVDKVVLYKTDFGAWQAYAYKDKVVYANHGCWYASDYSLAEVENWINGTYPNAKVESEFKPSVKTWGKSGLMDHA